MKSEVEKYLLPVILLVLAYMPIFGHLGNLPFRCYDEARLVTNAYEMTRNHNLIVTHFDGKPDMWNTKPPFFIWTQAAMIKVAGLNEVAVRMPSAIAAFLTCLLVYLLLVKYTKQPWFAFIAVFILITSNGYIDIHGTRTADYDSMLTLFTTAGCLVFFAYGETRNSRYLYLFFISLMLGVLTKSISGLFFLPGLFLYGLIRKMILPLLRNPHFYYGILIFVIPVLGYYLLREQMNPGYIEAVRINELGGRFSKVIEGHVGDFWYYYDHLRYWQFAAYFLLIPCGMITGLFGRDTRIRRVTLFSSIMSITFLYVLSTAKTKITWYDVPVYPFFAIMVAPFIFYIFSFLSTYQPIRNMMKINVIPIVFLFLLFITPYRQIINKTYKPQENPWEKDYFEMGYYLQKAMKGQFNLDGKSLVMTGYNPHYLLYVNFLQDQGVNIRPKEFYRLIPGDQVILFQPEVAKYIEKFYNSQKTDTFQYYVKTYKILGRKIASVYK